MYNEEEWLRLLFLMSDTQAWISEMEKDLFRHFPAGEIKKLSRKSYYLSATSFAHIIERHYYKMPHHPGASKFNIPVYDILYWLREGFYQPSQPLPGTSLFIRQWDTGACMGFNRLSHPTTILTILTETGGRIKTAFPGYMGLIPEFTCLEKTAIDIPVG